jgi:hypothetical protein
VKRTKNFTGVFTSSLGHKRRKKLVNAGNHPVPLISETLVMGAHLVPLRRVV